MNQPMRRPKSNSRFTLAEHRVFHRMPTPAKVQDFLNTLGVNFEVEGETCRSPRMVLRSGEANCLEGALFAACALQFHGHKPLVMDLVAYEPDVMHTVALFQRNGYWGAIGKTNHAVLRYREPVYQTIRELALSYFHEYFLDTGEKTLCQYSGPIDLSKLDSTGWQTAEEDIWYINEYLDAAKRHRILHPWQERELRKADPIEIAAGKLVEWDKRKRVI